MTSTVRHIRLACRAIAIALLTVPAHAAVELSGIDGAARDNVEAYLSLAREPCDSPEWKVRRLFTAADAQIIEALEVFGFYQASVDKQLAFADDCWTASFAIDPGPAVRIRSADVRIEGPGGSAPEFGKQISAANAKSQSVRKNVCTDRPTGGPAAPSLSDALGTSRQPPQGGSQRSGTFDTLTGNAIAR